jgi:hypothetical protein
MSLKKPYTTKTLKTLNPKHPENLVHAVFSEA